LDDQSLALVDLSPATVAFLGAATVIVCPTLEYFVDKKPMSPRDSPQTWLAATLCLVGVGVLELYDPTGVTSAAESFGQVGYCDFLAIFQAIGFGTSFFLTERMMRKQPEQALPITAVQVSVTAFVCMLWSVADGWIGQPGSESFGLPALFFDHKLQIVAAAVAWTGLATTALNRFLNIGAGENVLGRSVRHIGDKNRYGRRCSRLCGCRKTLALTITLEGR
jgi:drug/metabolite transporter (DMT)-like permease